MHTRVEDDLVPERSDWQDAAFKRMKQGHAWPGTVKPRELSFRELCLYEAGFAAGQKQTWERVEALARRKSFGLTLSARADPSAKKGNREQQVWGEVATFARGGGTPFGALKAPAIPKEVQRQLSELQAIARQARQLQQAATAEDARKKRVAVEHERLFRLIQALPDDAFGD